MTALGIMDFELYDAVSEGSSGKRVRDENLNPFQLQQQQQSTFITVSQEEEMTLENHPRSKRPRLGTNLSSSSSSSLFVGRATNFTTTTTTTTIDEGGGDEKSDCAEIMSIGEGEDENVPPTEWWHYQQHPTTAIATTTTPENYSQRCCFVCQTTETHQPATPVTTKVPMKPNTLLNYSFTATAAMARSHHERQQQQQQQHSSHSQPQSQLNLQNCSFCDRLACVSCTRHCERCRAQFCNLCSTLDYSSSRTTELCFCLDCLVVVATDMTE